MSDRLLGFSTLDYEELLPSCCNVSGIISSGGVVMAEEVTENNDYLHRRKGVGALVYPAAHPKQNDMGDSASYGGKVRGSGSV